MHACNHTCTPTEGHTYTHVSPCCPRKGMATSPENPTETTAQTSSSACPPACLFHHPQAQQSSGVTLSYYISTQLDLGSLQALQGMPGSSHLLGDFLPPDMASGPSGTDFWLLLNSPSALWHSMPSASRLFLARYHIQSFRDSALFIGSFFWAPSQPWVSLH